MRDNKLTKNKSLKETLHFNKSDMKRSIAVRMAIRDYIEAYNKQSKSINPYGLQITQGDLAQLIKISHHTKKPVPDLMYKAVKEFIKKYSEKPNKEDLIKECVVFAKDDWQELQEIAKIEESSASVLARKAIKEFIKKHSG
jgi:predicted transcriptional regulator